MNRLPKIQKSGAPNFDKNAAIREALKRINGPSGKKPDKPVSCRTNQMGRLPEIQKQTKYETNNSRTGPKPNYTSGALAKYATLVGSAANGAITSPKL